jgi:hypothetical protein
VKKEDSILYYLPPNVPTFSLSSEGHCIVLGQKELSPKEYNYWVIHINWVNNNLDRMFGVATKKVSGDYLGR